MQCSKKKLRLEKMGVTLQIGAYEKPVNRCQVEKGQPQVGAYERGVKMASGKKVRPQAVHYVTV